MKKPTGSKAGHKSSGERFPFKKPLAAAEKGGFEPPTIQPQHGYLTDRTCNFGAFSSIRPAAAPLHLSTDSTQSIRSRVTSGSKRRGRPPIDGRERIQIYGSIATILAPTGESAIIDADDFEKAAAFTWSCGSGYFRANARRPDGGRYRLPLHRLLLDAPPGTIVDHINGDTLDNRKSNLRFATAAGNAQNHRRKTCLKGAKWCPRARAFSSSIRAHGVNQHLGYFDTIEEAAQAYDNAAALLHGEFASFNNGPDGMPSRRRRANKFSPYKGANWNPKYRHWVGQISIHGRSTYLGLFKSDLEAAQAYDRAAVQIFGDGAALNFPTEPKKIFEKINSQIPRNPNIPQPS